MTIKQLSVFMENKPGQLAAFTKVLEANNINMQALSVAETLDFGILRVIVDDPYKCSCVLRDAGYVFQVTPVLAAEVPDKPGALVKLLDILGGNGLNLEYTYAFTTRKPGFAYMILRVDKMDEAKKVLTENGVKLVCQSELNAL